MTATTSFADSPYYRPLSLRGYSPTTWGDTRADVIAESRARREIRRQNRLAADALRKQITNELSVSLSKAIVTMAASAVIGFGMFGYLSGEYSRAEATGLGGSVSAHDAVVATESGDGEVLVPSEPVGIDGWEVPDIAGDCPIVYQRAEDGSFVNTNGVVLGAGCKFGVDVSEHDGQIDWETAKANGVDFAIIRCGYGADNYAYDDALWEYNVSECERLGIPYGAYLYSYAPDPSYAASEAEHVIRMVEGHSVPLGVWYDIEEGGQAEAFGYDADLFSQLVNGFAEAVEARTGINVGVYTSRSWLDEHMSKVYSSGSYPLWCACWTDGCPTGVEYDYWQAGAALIPGFNHQVDFDVILG